MVQHISYRIRNKVNGKSVTIKCELHFQETKIKVVFLTNKNQIKLVVGTTRSLFLRALTNAGKSSSTIKFSDGYLTAILNKLKKEIGGKCQVLVKPSTQPKIGVRKRIVKKAAKKVTKKKTTAGKKRVVIKKAVKKQIPHKKTFKKKVIKKKTRIERFSNFTGSENVSFKLKYDKDFYDFKDIIAEKEAITYSTINVFFSTDRKKTNSKMPNEIYSKERSDANDIEYGICEVSIPSNHKIGNIERPTWWKNIFYIQPENPEKDIAILKLENKNETDFINALNSTIGASSKHDAFIFIHGFNVKFDDAVRRTAQIAFDLSFKGAPITYSWPSLGTLDGYFSDEDSVKWTVPHLKNFIKKVLSINSILKLHLIAHSMGNRAMTDALRELKAENFDLSKINQIILAAPDIDVQIFTDMIVPGINGVANQITLYASSNDKALMASKKVHRSKIRAGESGNNMVIAPGISTVDASNVETDLLGHGYFASTKELIQDIFLMLEHAFTPLDRKLRQKSLPPRGVYWLFPA